MSAPIPEAELAKIKQAVFSGRKIEAIKLYRECTEKGLAEAKSEVENLEAELRVSSPDKFSSAPSGKGCLGAAAVLCLVVAMAVGWLIWK